MMSAIERAITVTPLLFEGNMAKAMSILN
jgi:hypothetical protein